MTDYFQIYEPSVYYKSAESMEEIHDGSVQLIITSPPYGQIKDYNVKEQIGFQDSFETYFSRLKKVWQECYRVLEPHCRLVINIGDQYLRTSEYGRYRILSIASRIIEDCTSLGFDFLGDLIWQKVSTTNTTGGCSLMGSIYYPRNGLLTYDYEHILIFKKYKGKKRKVSRERKEFSKIPLTEWKRWYVGHWKFSGITQKEHVAMFPEELPYRIIRMFSFIGDTILDPFVGSGTTLKVAKALSRKGIGYDINPEFKTIIQRKLEEAERGAYQDYHYLLYKISQLSQNNHLSIKFHTQKGKGILILADQSGCQIIIDYLLLDGGLTDDEVLTELKGKLEENTVQNFLKGKKSWQEIERYVIIINGKIGSQGMKKLKTHLRKESLSTQIIIVSYKDFVSAQFSPECLF